MGTYHVKVFREVLGFELRRALRRPAVYIYWLILFALGFLIMNLLGGAFDSVRFVIAGDGININSPRIMDTLLSAVNYVGVFIPAAIVGAVVYKDFRYQTISLNYTTPVGKAKYLLGRFLAAWLLGILVFTGPVLGLMLGNFMPYLEREWFGPFNVWAYLYPFLTKLMPNLFFITGLFFMLTLLLRNMVVNWMAIVGLYVLYALAMRLLGDLDNRTLAALLDPFGIASTFVVSTGQSADTANNEVVRVADVLLWNRLLWTGLGLVCLIWAMWRFRFAFGLRQVRLGKKRRRQGAAQGKGYPVVSFRRLRLPAAPVQTGTRAQWLRFWWLLKHEWCQLVSNRYFILITALGLGLLFLSSRAIGRTYDTATYPVTYQVIGVLQGTFSLFVFVVIVLFSGELVWRERNLRVEEIHDALPVRRWVVLGSKMLALAGGVLLMVLCLIAGGVLIQWSRGYHAYELNQYASTVLGLEGINYLLMIGLAFFVQTVVNQKYMGYIVMVVYYVLDSFVLPALLPLQVFRFGSDTGYLYSDMNGYGAMLYPYLFFKVYWLLLVACLVVASNQFMVVGKEVYWRKRWQLFKVRLRGPAGVALLSLAIAFVGLGGFAFYNTHTLNGYEPPSRAERAAVTYEETYRQYRGLPQPKFVSADVQAELYPATGELALEAAYWLKNKTAEPIQELHWQMNRERITQLGYDRGHEVTLVDDDLGYYIHRLENALLPGDSMHVTVAYQRQPAGFSNNGDTRSVQPNGTFLTNSMLPRLGYQDGRELRSNRIRKQYGLEERPLARSLTDEVARGRNFIAADADFMQLKVTVGTAAEQRGLAPGKLISEWTEGNRRYTSYEMEGPVQRFWAILSAEYAVKRERWEPQPGMPGQPVDLEIYYHEGHEYNLDRMMAGMQASLSYYSQHFAAYPYSVLRIVEFPRFASYAQSFPTLIPFSEGIGFIADLRELQDSTLAFEDMPIDYPFFVTAHEVAHQWWAHQVTSADVEGTPLVIESLSQYSALMVMQDVFGKERMRKFLREELFDYLMGRGREQREERPLATSDYSQQTTFYNKGAVVLYGLNAYLGNNAVNQALQRLNRRFALNEKVYPTSTDLIDELRAVAPDSMQSLITDWLEEITLYDFEVGEAHYERTDDLMYHVEVPITFHKYKSNAAGKEEEVPTGNDWADVVITNSKGKVLYNERIRMWSGAGTLRVSLTRKPSVVEVDPNYHLITKDFMREQVDVVKRAADEEVEAGNALGSSEH